MTVKQIPSNDYVVVIRAGSRLRFLPNEQLSIVANLNERQRKITFRTRYSEEGFQSAVPRELWIDARGPASTLNNAIEDFTNMAMFFTTVISFCINGYAGDCKFHLAYDNSVGKKQRDFFQQFVHEEHDMPSISRRIDPELVKVVINKLGEHKRSERLRRAISQYALALSYWNPGNEILATAHLFMGTEALVPIYRDIELIKSGLGKAKELASKWKISIKELDSTIRRRFLFKGDQKCHRDAKRASDSFEHGFLPFHIIRPLASTVRNKTAKYLRGSLLELLDLPLKIENQLKNFPYDKPLGTVGYIRYLRGKLISDKPELARPDQAYPIVEWRFKIKSFAIKDRKEFNLNFSQNITPRLAKDVSLQLQSIKIFGPEGFIATPKKLKIADDSKDSLEEKDEKFSRQQIVNLLDDICTNVMNYANNEFFESTLADFLVFSIYSRARSTFQGAVTLIKQNLPEEALVLSLSLFDDAIKLKELAENLDEKNALLLGMVNQDLKDKKRILRRAARSLEDEDIKEGIKKAKFFQRRIKETAKNNNIKQLKDFTPEEFAAQFFSSDTFRMYYISKMMLNDPNSWLNRRVKAMEGNRLMLESNTDDLSFIGEAAASIIEAIMTASDSVAKIMGWEEIKKFKKYKEQLNMLYSIQ
jgi:hypothetical protein